MNRTEIKSLADIEADARRLQSIAFAEMVRGFVHRCKAVLPGRAATRNGGAV